MADKFFWTLQIESDSLPLLLRAIEIDDFDGFVSTDPTPQQIEVVTARLLRRASLLGLGMVLFNPDKSKHWYWPLLNNVIGDQPR